MIQYTHLQHVIADFGFLKVMSHQVTTIAPSLGCMHDSVAIDRCQSMLIYNIEWLI